jgi:hypothetical protein
MAEEQGIMPADFLADRRAEGEQLRGRLIRMAAQLIAIAGFALVALVPLTGAARARRLRAEQAQLRLRETRAVMVGLKTRERWAGRFQARQAPG